MLLSKFLGSLFFNGVLLVTLVCSLLTVAQTPEWNEPEVVSYLGTKTPYRVVANRNDSLIEFPGCFPKKIFGVVRHGTRTPGNKVINKIKNIIASLKLRSGERDVISQFTDLTWKSKELKEWSSLLQIGTEKVLTNEGEIEMFWLGRRFQNRFPSLMPKVFSNNSYFVGEKNLFS